MVFGDLRQVVPSPFAEFVIILVSIICGAIVGTERQRAEKPAGLRTLSHRAFQGDRADFDWVETLEPS